MTARNHFIFWTGVGVALLALIYILKSILLPFVLGFALAYFLNPTVKMLTKSGMGRGFAGLLILSGFLIILGGIMIILAPVLYQETIDFLDNLPAYLRNLAAMLQPFVQKLQALVGQGTDIDLMAMLNGHADKGINAAGSLVKGIVNKGQSAFHTISLLVLTPIVSYFMIKEWDNVTQWCIDLMPRDKKNTIMELLREIDRKISGFVRGQVSVAFILGIIYALALTLIDLNNGFLIGLGAGFLSIIPMVGSFVGLLVGVIVAWVQTGGDWGFILMVAGVFLGGQLIEGNFLTPRLVGRNVGLHPLWVFFALLAGGSLMGLLGMVIAVPVVAIIGVLGGFALKQYKESAFYRKSPSTKHASKRTPPKTSGQKTSGKKKETS